MIDRWLYSYVVLGEIGRLVTMAHQPRHFSPD
jgi:hypothetical protein